MDNINDILFNNVKLLNSKLNANHLTVYLPDGFSKNLVDDPLSPCVFVSKKDSFLAQFVVGGHVDGESLEELIANEIKKIENASYYKDFQSSDFSFKIYKQDIEVPIGVIKQLYAYFIDPTDSEFYQLSIAFGPCKREDANIKSDFIYGELEKMLFSILGDIKYVEQDEVR